MLQVERVPSIAIANGDQPISQAELLAALFRFVRRQYRLVLVVMLLAIGWGVAYLFTTPPLYSGRAALAIDVRRVQAGQPQSVGDVNIDAAMMIESQVEIIKSDTVASSVINDLHLTEDPEFVGSGGGLMQVLLSLIPRFSTHKQSDSESAPTQRALASFQGRLTVKRIGLTYVLEITFQSHDPDRAAQIANAVADAYILDQLESKYQVTRRAAAWLQDRLKDLRKDASTAERAVVDFKSENNIVDAGGRLINEQQLAELNSALVQARAQVAESKARLDRVNNILQTGDPDPMAVATGAVTDSLHNEVITKLRQTYLEDAATESTWSRRYGRDHLAAVNLRNQMLEIRRNITDELRRIAESYQSDFEIAKAREISIQGSLDKIVASSQTTNQSQIALHELESASVTTRALYDNFLQRYMESVQQQSFPITEARVVTHSLRPLSKSSPKTFLVLAVAAFGGGILGVGLAIVRDLSDRVFRTPGQVENELQSDCIAIVPLIRSNAKRHSEADNLDLRSEGRQFITRDHSVWWQIIDAPLSRFAESIRSIKLAVDSANTTGSKVIGITSSLPNEGKSTIAMALAELIAATGGHVVLVDCDLRNSLLSRRLAPGVSAGIIELICGEVSVHQALWRDTSINLFFLPRADEGLIPHSAELLSSTRTKAIFDELREHFDYIIVDLSPLVPVVDVRASSGLIDHYVFVVEWGRTKIEVIEHALKTGRAIHENLLGVVLNKADMSELSRYDGRHHDNVYSSRYYIE